MIKVSGSKSFIFHRRSGSSPGSFPQRDNLVAYVIPRLPRFLTGFEPSSLILPSPTPAENFSVVSKTREEIMRIEALSLISTLFANEIVAHFFRKGVRPC